MATAANYPNRMAVQPRQAEKPAFNMVERKDPRFVQFGDGEMITGVLVSIERIKVNDKPASRYTVEDLDTKELCAFLGTFQIDAKLRPVDVGHVIEVRCEGTDSNVGRNGNSMKLFKVLVSDRTAPGWAYDGTPITNDDIPFA